MSEATQEHTPRVPAHLEPDLESVLTGKVDPARVQGDLGLTDYQPGVLLRALIRRRARELNWLSD